VGVLNEKRCKYVINKLRQHTKHQKNMYPRKTRHEKSRGIIYEFSYKMSVLNEKRCKFQKIMWNTCL
jgi:hypothetical protein